MVFTTHGVEAGYVPARAGIAIAVAALVTLAATVPAAAYDGPSFRKGLWRFERATEMLGLHAATMPVAARMRIEPMVTRCVDPTEAMKETFRPVSVRSCHPTPPRRKGNVYIFALRCDYIGPVRTKIVVESDTAYREVHRLTVGPAPRQEVIVARRIGDCVNDERTARELAAHQPLQLVPEVEDGELTLSDDED